MLTVMRFTICGALCVGCGDGYAAIERGWNGIIDASYQGTIIEEMDMATDAQIQKFAQRHHGFIPKTGWIAHVKEAHGIPTLREANRARLNRDVERCPPKSARRSKRRFGISA
jgi:hypothetical protein